MSPRKYACKTDRNQQEIMDAFRKLGATVQDLSACGKGVPDLLVGYNGLNYLCEVKDHLKPPSARKLTPDQMAWHGEWLGQVCVVETVEDVEKIIKKLKLGL